MHIYSQTPRAGFVNLPQSSFPYLYVCMCESYVCMMHVCMSLPKSSSPYLYVCVYVCMNPMYVCMNPMYVCMNPMYVCMKLLKVMLYNILFVYICAHKNVTPISVSSVYSCIHTCMHTYRKRHEPARNIHTCMHYMHESTTNVHTCMHTPQTYIHACIHTGSGTNLPQTSPKSHLAEKRPGKHLLYICVRVCVYIHTYQVSSCRKEA